MPGTEEMDLDERYQAALKKTFHYYNSRSNIKGPPLKKSTYHYPRRVKQKVNLEYINRGYDLSLMDTTYNILDDKDLLNKIKDVL